MLEVVFVPPALPTEGALVLPLFEAAGNPAAADSTPPGAAGPATSPAASPALEAADAATGGAVSRGLAAAEFRGKSGQTAILLAPGGGLTRIVAVGLGKQAELTDLGAEEAGGHAAAALSRVPEISLAVRHLTGAQAAHVALGAALRAWRFDRYRTNEKLEEKPMLARVRVLTDDVAGAEKAWERLRATAQGAILTRELVSEPPNVLTPEEFARRLEKLAELGLDVEVFGPEKLAELGFGAMLAVAQGSAHEARMVVMRWSGTGETDMPPVAFIGKGVTFDSGGISIKPAQGMEDMKWDMAGAGAVVGVMASLAGRKAKVEAVGIVGLVENMPSGTAQRPGDVVRTASGQTVEIINTDAEGRMVLCDLLHYCQQRFSPRFMVDLATLTGAIVVALGHEQAGLFSNDDALADNLLAAGKATGEKLWRMPLGEAYDKQLKSDIADMKHVTGRPGSSITAAQFLQRFVNGKPWAHLDIAGMAWATKDAPLYAKGATGYGVRLLEQLVAANYETT
jgi:leucyl aminopeptidase